MEYIKTGKRFIVDIDENNNTSLIFGNGLLAEKYSTNQLNSIWQENEDINSLSPGFGFGNLFGCPGVKTFKFPLSLSSILED